MKFKPMALVAAASIAAFAVPAAAQDTTTTTTDPAMATPVTDDGDNDSDFPWGLLGLIGLAGLLGRKRDNDVRVDRTGTGNNRL